MLAAFSVGESELDLVKEHGALRLQVIEGLDDGGGVYLLRKKQRNKDMVIMNRETEREREREEDLQYIH